jgi:hypothetical protein
MSDSAPRRRPTRHRPATLLAAEIDGQRLSYLEFNMFFMLLINAGGDTTRNLVAGGMLTLLRHPAELARLRRDPGLLPSAIEEMLRYQSPVQHFRRTATRDARLGGRTIALARRSMPLHVGQPRRGALPIPIASTSAGAERHVAFGGGGTYHARREPRAPRDPGHVREGSRA